MKQSASNAERLRDLTDTDLGGDELERLARVDALLHCDVAARVARPCLRLVATSPATAGTTRNRSDKPTHELKLTFGELALVSKSLQAVKTLGALPPQDELLDDTIQVVDQALKRAM
jgi:hypothetical protein